MDARAYLVQRHGTGDDASGQRIPLSGEVTTIGRWEGSDLPIDDREVSRRHAQIRHDGTRYVLVDLGSKNGTRLNGNRVEGAMPLADGDEVTVGTRFRFLFVDTDATVPSRMRIRGIRINPDTRTVSVGGSELDPPLAPNQFNLLELLSSQQGKVFSRDDIASACYPEAEGGVSDQAIDGVVRRLRTRLLEADPTTEHIAAVRGHGFKLIG